MAKSNKTLMLVVVLLFMVTGLTVYEVNRTPTPEDICDHMLKLVVVPPGTVVTPKEYEYGRNVCISGFTNLEKRSQQEDRVKDYRLVAECAMKQNTYEDFQTYCVSLPF